MNKMRFGALLVSMDWRLGFYLSHRVILTVPHSGTVRAVSPKEFGKCKVFARNGVAIPFFDAMTAAAASERKFRNSLEMIVFFLNLPEKSNTEDLCEYMEHKHGANMEDFEIRQIEPETEEDTTTPQ